MLPDLSRIKAIPRRTYTPEEIAAYVADYTVRLKTPGGEMGLRPLQALALHEAETYGALLGFLPTGSGKSILSLLLAMVVPGCQRAVVLVPPVLKAKLINSDYPNLSKHWRLPSLADVTHIPGAPKLYPVSYSDLSATKNGDILDRIKPDLIIADEAHSVILASSRTKRLMRYIKENPWVKFMPMSGTLLDKSVRDISALSRVALRVNTPLPLDKQTLDTWAEVLDPQRDDYVPDWRAENAAKDLAHFCANGETLRQGFSRLLYETPGVVFSKSPRDCSSGLEFHPRPLKLDPAVNAVLTDLRKTWKLGDDELTDVVSFKRAARQLAAGLYTYWTYPRNEPLALRKEWLEKRSEWNKAVRNFLTYSAKKGLDSPALLEAAVSQGDLPRLAPVYNEWMAIKDQVQPEPTYKEVSDYMARDAVEWGKKHVGIIWTWHRALGPWIARLGDFPYFGDKSDVDAFMQERGERTVVLSANSFYQGFDMPFFSKQLFTTPSPSSRRMQQLLSRTHRTGQKADTITTWVYTHTPELVDALETCVKRSQFVEEMTQEAQLMCMATHLWST